MLDSMNATSNGFKKLQNVWVATVLMSSHALKNSCVAPKLFNALHSISFKHLIVVWPFQYSKLIK